nr:MAG TPA: hypothetical protein [Caudoviricetes sp.]
MPVFPGCQNVKNILPASRRQLLPDNRPKYTGMLFEIINRNKITGLSPDTVL